MSPAVDLLLQFQLLLNQKKLFAANDVLLLAVSGGIDSVVLCELCHRSGIPFHIAHANFQLRGVESERDEQFVSFLAEKYQVPLHVKRFDTLKIASQQKLSVQQVAREERYKWFKEILAGIPANKKSAKYVLTAHHLDDDIETMLMHFFRGTGIHGLRGILLKHDNVVRPLLQFRKTDLVKFATQSKLEWVEDSSNESNKYTRNYFRNQLLPALREVYKDVDQNLANNLTRMKETEILFNEAISIHKKKLMEKNGNEIYLLVEKLKNFPAAKTLLHEIITAYGYSAAQVDDVVQLLYSETGRFVDSDTHRVFRNRARLVITPKETRTADHILIEEDLKEYIFPSGHLLVEQIKKPGNISTDPLIALLDKTLIGFPLLLRRWKAGDYFYPLGMKKKKKIARFLIDLKLSKTDKEKIWVIEMDKKILWIVGIRIDERFKISDNTEHVVRLVYIPLLNN